MSGEDFTRIILEDLVKLGMLYDIRSDEFLKYNLFNDEIPKSAISEMEKNIPDIYYSNDATTEEISKKSVIDGELKVSILLGRRGLEVKTSAEYSKTTDIKKNTVRINVSYRCKSRVEQINMGHKELGAILNQRAINNATHFIYSITYGTNAILNFEIDFNTKEEAQSFSGNFEARMSTYSGGISNTSVGKSVTSNNNFRCHIQGVGLSVETIPQSLIEAQQLVEKITQLKSFDPLEVVLSPIRKLPFKLEMNHIISFRLTSDDLLKLLDVFFRNQKTLKRCNSSLGQEYSSILEKRKKESQILIYEKITNFKSLLCEENEIKDLLKILGMLFGLDCLKFHQNLKVTIKNDHNPFDFDVKVVKSDAYLAKHYNQDEIFLFCGVALLQGYKGQMDRKGAKDCFDNAIAMGNSTAMRNMGILCYFGQAMPRDYNKAKEWFEKSASLDNSDAMVDIGEMYRNGFGIVADKDFPCKWGGPKADKKQKELSPGYLQAKKWFERGAALGNSEAICSIGVLYNNGCGVSQDYFEAKKFFEKSAALDNALAMRFLAEIYYYGNGVPLNYTTAKNWYERSAELGDSPSMTQIGILYQNGWGVSQDYAMAKNWYEKAAVLGNLYSMKLLSKIYEFGYGVPKDVGMARNWISKSQ